MHHEPERESTPSDPGPTPVESEHWRRLLTGEDASLRSLRRVWHRIPHGPRCKVCGAPFEGAGGLFTRVVQHGRSTANPTMCGLCFAGLADHPGGAELDVGVVFADIRGSTGIAERIGALAFRSALQEFYTLAARAIEDNLGFVDKYLGDGVMALFVPVTAGTDYHSRTLTAAIELVRAVEASALPASGVRVGAGAHLGPAFIDVMGSGDKLDFSALGDPVNVAARLGALAGPGEVLASRELWLAAGRTEPASARSVEITGRTEPLDVVVVTGIGATDSPIG